MPKCKNDSTRSYKGTEPSPKGKGYCAHAEKIGSKKKGNDGNKWEVKTTKTGTKRWVPLHPENKKSTSKGFHTNIEKDTLQNKNYRKVINTTVNMQLVLMSLLPSQDIGIEQHTHTSQFIRVESGSGQAIIAGEKYNLKDGDIVVIPPKTQHNIINTHKSKRLQLYTIYTPPEHKPNTIEKIKK